MNLLAFCAAAFLFTQAAVADLAAPPATARTVQPQAAPMPTTPATTPAAAAPCLPCPCVSPPVYPTGYYQPNYPVDNVAPWSWQHDNQNDDEWPADHGG